MRTFPRNYGNLVLTLALIGTGALVAEAVALSFPGEAPKESPSERSGFTMLNNTSSERSGFTMLNNTSEPEVTYAGTTVAIDQHNGEPPQVITVGTGATVTIADIATSSAFMMAIGPHDANCVPRRAEPTPEVVAAK